MKSEEQQISDFQPSEEIQDAYNRWQRANRHYDPSQRVMERVATSNGLEPWQGTMADLSFEGDEVDISAEWDGMRKELDPIVKQSPQQRLASLTQQLIDDVITQYRVTGRVILARSVMTEIQQIFWRMGTPVTEEQLQQFTESQLIGALETLAADVLREVERKGQGNVAYVPDIKVTKGDE